MATPTNDKSRVLVVDDEPQITRVLRTVLTSQGYQVQTAGEGQAALANFNEWHPELVITDLFMPRMDGNEVRLTPKEFDLFVYMARHPNKVITHRTLLEAVWGEASQEQPEYLRVFMGQLRKKLEPDPSNPRYLVTEPWVGYRFNPNG